MENYSRCRSQKLPRGQGEQLPTFPFCIFPLSSSSVQNLQFLKLQKSCSSVGVRKESSLLQGVTLPSTPLVKFRAIAHKEHSWTQLLQYPQVIVALACGSSARYNANVSLLSWQEHEQELAPGNGWTRRHICGYHSIAGPWEPAKFKASLDPAAGKGKLLPSPEMDMKYLSFRLVDFTPGTYLRKKI